MGMRHVCKGLARTLLIQWNDETYQLYKCPDSLHNGTTENFVNEDTKSCGSTSFREEQFSFFVLNWLKRQNTLWPSWNKWMIWLEGQQVIELFFIGPIPTENLTNLGHRHPWSCVSEHKKNRQSAGFWASKLWKILTGPFISLCQLDIKCGRQKKSLW